MDGGLSLPLVMLPVAVQVPVAGLYSSALLNAVPYAAPPADSTFPLASSVAVWPNRATFMLPVLSNPPEPAEAGVAVITVPIANKLIKRSERFALNLLLTDNE